MSTPRPVHALYSCLAASITTLAPLLTLTKRMCPTLPLYSRPHGFDGENQVLDLRGEKKKHIWRVFHPRSLAPER